VARGPNPSFRADSGERRLRIARTEVVVPVGAAIQLLDEAKRATRSLAVARFDLLTIQSDAINQPRTVRLQGKGIP